MPCRRVMGFDMKKFSCLLFVCIAGGLCCGGSCSGGVSEARRGGEKKADGDNKKPLNKKDDEKKKKKVKPVLRLAIRGAASTGAKGATALPTTFRMVSGASGDKSHKNPSWEKKYFDSTNSARESKVGSLDAGIELDAGNIDAAVAEAMDEAAAYEKRMDATLPSTKTTNTRKDDMAE
ncbi:hypothetical protein [Candidatus Hydrogenosomobacter endosymbioticus]|uniref:Uncharacterized protein n=1 Tax=Candidatus Hydrogenosomobacter endosymbioticus TaxID=2558174 RepID=A0ABN6L3M8_9PROT|nr:hypothetical protein [Candidatus Hydrogenosomobacter endosymbioticus]BDB96339.1 hypothetical protein HYD_4720 [Candidatus Hydrogenosomobacter endosymbioticus]